MDIEIRREQPSDHKSVETVVREAFWNRFSPGCTEHYLVHIMRTCPTFVPELDCVAVLNGEVVGHVAYMKARIEGDDGAEHEVLSLGPIAVLPTCQRQGIGGRLIEHTREIARNLGYSAILLCGDPAYYLNQGFVPAETLGIRTEDDRFAVALHICVLQNDAGKTLSGRYIEDPAYLIDESAAAEYDAAFPPKEPISSTPSQKRFAEIVAMSRKAE